MENRDILEKLKKYKKFLTAKNNETYKSMCNCHVSVSDMHEAENNTYKKCIKEFNKLFFDVIEEFEKGEC